MKELKWTNAQGVRMYPWEMTSNHLKNAIAHVQEWGTYSGELWESIFQCELMRRKVVRDSADEGSGIKVGDENYAQPEKRDERATIDSSQQSLLQSILYQASKRWNGRNEEGIFAFDGEDNSSNVNNLLARLKDLGVNHTMHQIDVPTDAVKRAAFFRSRAFTSLPTEAQRFIRSSSEQGNLTPGGVITAVMGAK